jgi:hypothetical protein
MVNLVRVARGAAVSALAAGAAHAADITQEIHTTVGGFEQVSGAPASSPFFVLSYDFTVTYNPAQSSSTPSPVTFLFAPTAFPGMSFGFDNTVSAATFNLVGLNGLGYYINVQNEFLATSEIEPGSYLYASGPNNYAEIVTPTGEWIAQVGNSGFFGSTTITDVLTGVPEPATWAMMLIGFGSLGMVLRGRRREGDAIA